MDHLLTDIATTYHLRRRGDRWDGPCPQCGGSATSNRFAIRDDGGYKCYACGFKGDIISWLRTMAGMTCPDAHLAAGKACQAQGCPVRGACRLGDGSGRRPETKAPRSVAPLVKQPPACPKLETRPAVGPGAAWGQWATAFVAASAAAIAGNSKVLAWLAGRGIDQAAVSRFRLGWHGRDDSVARARIGLPPKGDKPTLWLPQGLVIPTIDAKGEVCRLRIRQDEARPRYIKELKYYWVDGSGTAPMVIRPAGRCRGAVVVEAELDALACAAAHPEVMVVALGTVKASIPEELRQELAAAPVVLVALDADGPGAAAVRAWLWEFRHARPWPVPAGKDPGDYVQQYGGDLAAWLEAGLPPATAVGSGGVGHEPGLVPDGQQGGAGVVDSVTDDAFVVPVDCVAVELADGRRVLVTDNREAYSVAVAQGELVFSMGELQRARECGGIEALLAVKDVFRGAYIGARRGE